MADDRPDHRFKNSVGETEFILAQFPDTPQFEVYMKHQSEVYQIGTGDSIEMAMEDAADDLDPIEDD